MARDTLKLVFVPWGANDYGDDVWLLENALIFGLESILEILPPVGAASYADLYEQLGGSDKKTALAPAYREADLRALAARTPDDTDALLDGMLTVTRDPDTDALREVQIAPRLLRLPGLAWETPGAFAFTGFSPHQQGRKEARFEDLADWFALIVAIAEAVLAPLGAEVPSYIDAERLQITQSWGAYADFLKGKRLARTVDEKLGYYKQAARQDPKFFWAHFNSGQLHKQQTDYHAARRDFLACVPAAKGDPALLGDAYFELGLCSIFLGDPKTARHFWDEALAYTPDNPTLLVNIAGTYEQEEDWNAAIAFHERALALAPEYVKALASIARLKAQQGKIDEAIPLYERALELEPDDPLRYAILGGCYLSLGDNERARARLTRASELDPPRARDTVRIDETDAPPPPGEYARQELAKMDAFKAQEKPKSWRWFGKS